jgi:dipeptidyl aminopeptidase/acylaminoacyl peptidase
VRDMTTGRERRWIAPTNPNPFETITQLEWSPDSSHLSYLLNAGRITAAWVLDINRGTTLTDGIQLPSPDASCTLWVPRFQPGTNLIVAAENCIGRSAQLVSYDVATGAIIKTAPVATGAVFGIIDLAIDASGQHLLYILSYEANQPSEVYTLRNGGPVRLLSDAYEVAW